MSNNELRHFKYVEKYKKNGKWIYVYPGEKATKNAFGRVRGGTNSLEAHQRLNREATNQVAKNTPSRNVPGANDQTSTSGKQMSKLQQDKAKYMAYHNKKMSGASKEDQKAYREQLNQTWHKNQLRGSNSTSSGEGKEKPVQQTSKQQIRQGIRRAKINTLKRDAAQAINRAQEWMKKLFD